MYIIAHISSICLFFFQETYLLYLVNRLEARKAFTLDNLELIWHAWKQG